MDVDLAQPLLQLSAQGRQAQRGTVVEQVRRLAAGDVADGVAQFFLVAPAIRHPAATQLQLLAAVAELAPGRLHGFPPFAFFAARRRGHEEAGAVARFQQAQRHQPVVGVDHAGLAELLLLGQLADGGQPGAGADAAAPYPGAQLIGDLLRQRLPAGAVEF
nr:hypothetical protein [Chromobacterium haemolyticum]